jgi:hypothetical protein
MGLWSPPLGLHKYFSKTAVKYNSFEALGSLLCPNELRTELIQYFYL